MKNLLSKLRMWQWALVAIATAVGLYFLAPEQIGLLLLKTSYITIALVIGYYADRVLFPYCRPHIAKKSVWVEVGYGHNGKIEEHIELTNIYIASMIRRAIVVAAVVIGFAIAL